MTGRDALPSDARQGDAPGAPPPAPAHIVGIGASAGGLEALQRLFERLPADTGLAFVVVQHLSPDFKSLMEELLSRHTKLLVKRVVDGVAVEPNVVYLIPPNTDMILSNGRLLLTTRDPDQARTLPIDLFLRSLAQEAGPRAIGVILSGTGSDGSRGVRAIHEAGGTVYVQDERTAKFDGMPRSAQDTGVVDFVLPPEGIAEALAASGREGAARPPASLHVASTDGADELGALFQRLRRAYGIDFSLYKATTIGRRVQRRMSLGGIRDLTEYVERLGESPDELDALYRDLLIGVTRFFRDEEAWARLREALVAAIERLGRDEEMRVWVAACATGAEAYTAAMLCLDVMSSLGRPPRLKVFATDAHRGSLDVASAGRYDAEALAHVPPALRDRYFEASAGGEVFVARPELRAHIVFAPHDLLRSAPFTRLDLVTCRNLLIYFVPTAQRKVLSLFHFALKTSGLLLLGPSESPGDLADEFHALDDHWKLYRKRRDLRLPGDLRLSTPDEQGRARRLQHHHGPQEQLVSDVRRLLVQELAPPTLVIDAQGQLVEALNGASQYLVTRDGPPTLDALDLIHRDVKLALAHGLRRAMERQEGCTIPSVRAAVGGEEVTLEVSVRPLKRGDKIDCCAVLLRRERPLPEASRTASPEGTSELAAERLEQVELELRRTKESLQATIEELETSNEELQATNEELVASNEELQSTNEELHSVNEELYTVNAEHQLKIGQLTELTADMDNLLVSTEVHTLFLDRELRLRKFTPKLAESFNLLPQDVGRRIDTFSHTLDHADLLGDLRAVLEGGRPIEREVHDAGGRELLIRVLPYRARDRLDGLVVTLIDVSLLKQAQRELQRTADRYRTLVRAVSSVVWTSDPDLRFVQPQAEWQASTGQADLAAYGGRGWIDAVHPEDQGRVRAGVDAAVARREVCEVRCRIWSEPASEHRHVVLRAAPILSPDGTISEWVGTLSDVHDETLAEEEHRRTERQLQGIVDNSPLFIHVKDLHGRYLLASPRCRAVLGCERERVIGRTDLDLLPPDVADRIRASDRKVALLGGVHELEETLPGPEGPRTFLSVKFPLLDDQGRTTAIAGIASDITDRKRASERDRDELQRRDRFLAMLSHELRNPLAAVVTANYSLLHPELSGPAAARAPRVIQRQVDHMNRLLDDLLDVSRLTRDKIALRREVMDLAATVRDVSEAFADRFAAAKLRLDVTVGERPLRVDGDPVRLQQVYTNLLTNALRYTPAGGAVTVRLTQDGGQAALSVRDSGIGIDPRHLERIFELFYQEDQSLDRARGGLGVGLTLVREIVQLHGGRVVARSEGLGKGTELVVTLPLAPGVVEDAGDAARVVVIEDLSDTRELLAMLLVGTGHRVETAADGEAGLAAIESLRPQVAFVDIGLPGLDGHELARRIRASSAGGRLYMVAVTGSGRAADRQRALEAGFDECLVKPLDPDALFALVERARRPR